MPPNFEAIITGQPHGAVQDHAEVELAGDGHRLLDQHLLHEPSLGAGLLRDQPHAEDPRRHLHRLVRAGGELDAARLAAPPGVDLRLDDDLAAQPFGHGAGLLAAR